MDPVSDDSNAESLRRDSMGMVKDSPCARGDPMSGAWTASLTGGGVECLSVPTRGVNEGAMADRLCSSDS